jgi:uncharacterized protein
VEYGEITVMTKEDILGFLSSHKPELQERFGVVSIGLFGSYARGEARVDSDIDIAVEMRRYEADAYFGLLHFLEDNLQQQIDLGIASNIKPLLKPFIEKEIVYV